METFWIFYCLNVWLGRSTKMSFNWLLEVSNEKILLIQKWIGPSTWSSRTLRSSGGPNFFTTTGSGSSIRSESGSPRSAKTWRRPSRSNSTTPSKATWSSRRPSLTTQPPCESNILVIRTTVDKDKGAPRPLNYRSDIHRHLWLNPWWWRQLS